MREIRRIPMPDSGGCYRVTYELPEPDAEGNRLVTKVERLKPRVARTNGRWYVRSAPFTPGEDPASFWEYWDLLSAAAKWCTMMNESQAWKQWGGRANHDDISEEHRPCK